MQELELNPFQFFSKNILPLLMLFLREPKILFVVFSYMSCQSREKCAKMNALIMRIT